jgi:hypothetical protein
MYPNEQMGRTEAAEMHFHTKVAGHVTTDHESNEDVRELGIQGISTMIQTCERNAQNVWEERLKTESSS